MDEQKHHPERKDFQIDRMILFTDAVFAIAITLLVLNIHIPKIAENGTDRDFLKALIQQLPKMIGLFISFFMIALYWYVYHSMFGWVRNYTPKLIWMNMIFLFSIVLMPFSTSVYSEYSTTENFAKLILPFAIYVANVCFTGIMNFFLLNYIFSEKNDITEQKPNKENIKLSKIRALTIPSVFLFSLLMTYITPEWGRLFIVLIPIVMRLFKNKKVKKTDEITIET